MTTTFSNISSTLNKVTLIALLSLTTIASLASSTGLNAQAASGSLQYNYLQATPSDGVNLRNGKCEKIKAVNQGTILIQNVYLLDGDNQNLTCTVGGKGYKMIPVNVVSETKVNGPYTGTYVAKEFTSIIGNIGGGENQKVNSPNGLNLRDKNCKKVSTLANNTDVKVDYSTNSIYCKVNGQMYHLQALVGSKYAASLFLK